MEKKFKLGPLKKREKRKKLPVKSRPLSWPGLLLKTELDRISFYCSLHILCSCHAICGS